MLSQFRADLYYRADCQLAEGPVWDKGVLYWVDIPGKAIYAKPDEADKVEHYDLPLEPGTLVLTESGGMLVATSEGFQSFDPKTRKLVHLANPEPGNAANRFNDGKCDPVGRFVAGTLNRERQPTAALYSFEEGKPVRKIYAPVTCSNGLAWSADGSTLYYIDTATSHVKAFHYDLPTGDLSDERVVVEIDKATGKPDGMTIDTEGNLWIAIFQGSGIECWNPEKGERIARIEVPARNVTCCVFGGANYETLFITTSRNNDPGVAGQDLGGSIFRATTGRRGYPVVRFRGSPHAAGTK
jgi:sugar lactone lactonase YvrE